MAPIALWRGYQQTYGLRGCQCIQCEKVYYPKKYVCMCGAMAFKEFQFSGKGILITYTQVWHSTERFSVPYCLGIIELVEGVRILAQITDVLFEELKIGMPVQAVVRKLYEDGPKGIISYSIKFSACGT